MAALESLLRPSDFGIASTSTASAVAAVEASSSSNAPPSEDALSGLGNGHALLDPLTRALLHELTTRKEIITGLRREVQFWSSAKGKELERRLYAQDQPEPEPERGSRGEIDQATLSREEQLDEKLQEARARYEQTLDREDVKKAILSAADEQHAIITGLASSPYKQLQLPTPKETAQQPLRSKQQNAASSRLGQLAAAKRAIGQATSTPTDAAAPSTAPQPAEQDEGAEGVRPAVDMRTLVSTRDALSLRLLHRHAELQRLQNETRAVHKQTLARRIEMSERLDTLRALSGEIREQRFKLENDGGAGAVDADASLVGATTATGRTRIGKLKDALREVHDKAEMVKGVLRGLILEGGLDWVRDKELLALMLATGDEQLDSDEDIGLSDEEEMQEQQARERRRKSDFKAKAREEASPPPPPAQSPPPADVTMEQE